MANTVQPETPASAFRAKADVERLLSELGKAKSDLADYTAKATRGGS
jgi:hypothetical protein